MDHEQAAHVFQVRSLAGCVGRGSVGFGLALRGHLETGGRARAQRKQDQGEALPRHCCADVGLWEYTHTALTLPCGPFGALVVLEMDQEGRRGALFPMAQTGCAEEDLHSCSMLCVCVEVEGDSKEEEGLGGRLMDAAVCSLTRIFMVVTVEIPYHA